MRRARFLRSTPFRLAVIFSALFISAFVASSLIAVQTVRLHLLEKLDSEIEATFSVLASSYGDNDVEDLISLVQGQIAADQSNDQWLLLTDATGVKLAGNLPTVSMPGGWSTATASQLGLPGNEHYRVLAGRVGGNHLVVGESYADTEMVEEIVSRTFMGATLVVLLAAIAGGIVLALRLQRRMDAIAGTMARVSEGELHARIPRRGNGDDVDILSGQINTTLDRLSDLFETMKQVSADIAHDLKTPLNRLKMTIQEALGKQEAGLPVLGELAEADAESDRINATFDALLRIAQIEAGARRERFAPVALHDVLATIIDAYADVAADNGQTLTLAGDPGEAVLRGDRELLLQMCANLVENAMTHCAAGALIHIGLERSGRDVSIVVADDGPGIPQEERDKVLRRLYRLEKSRTTPGSGLGLSMVKAIADLHGGTLTLSDNAPGLRVVATFPQAIGKRPHDD